MMIMILCTSDKRKEIIHSSRGAYNRVVSKKRTSNDFEILSGLSSHFFPNHCGRIIIIPIHVITKKTNPQVHLQICFGMYSVQCIYTMRLSFVIHTNHIVSSDVP